MVENYKLIYTSYIHQQILENQTSILRKSGYQISGKVGTKLAEKWIIKFYDKVERKPIFMCIILGECSAIIKDKETGIYILPITALKP